MCESIEDAENHLDLMRKELIQPKVALQELKKRINISMDERMKKIEKEIDYLTNRLFARERWQYSQIYKWNFAAKYLAKTYKDELAKKDEDTKTNIHPTDNTLKIRDAILAQHDFAKRQHDLVRFYQHFLREPMIETLQEDPHWLYSLETNHKLLPKFLYELALEYVVRGEEGNRTLLEKIKQNQEISDDGHAIVDRNSGFVIAYIEYENEQLYDERGFKIKTGDVMETDPIVADNEDEFAIGQDNANATSTTLESEDMTMVKQIFDTYCRILEISPKEQKRGFSDFVIRVSLEYIEQNIMTPIDFTVQNEALIKKRKWDERKIQEQYKIYYQQYMVFLVTCMFLIGLQTIQPPIKSKKSIPGCVKSFDGYPLTENTENITGIQYMACILNTVKSSYPPWSSIKSAKREMIQESMIDQIAEIMERRNDIHELYLAQRSYREQHPEQFEIPKSYQLEKWMHLLPPAIRNIDIMNKLAKDRMLSLIHI
jgi:hypothetical protein